MLQTTDHRIIKNRIWLISANILLTHIQNWFNTKCC